VDATVAANNRHHRRHPPARFRRCGPRGCIVGVPDRCRDRDLLTAFREPSSSLTPAVRRNAARSPCRPAAGDQAAPERAALGPLEGIAADGAGPLSLNPPRVCSVVAERRRGRGPGGVARRFRGVCGMVGGGRRLRGDVLGCSQAALIVPERRRGAGELWVGAGRRSGGGGQRSDTGERLGEVGLPGPAGRQVQRPASGVTGQAAGQREQPATQGPCGAQRAWAESD
jgi:hypothetical protein